MSVAAALRAQARVLEALADELEQSERAPSASPDAWIAVVRPPADLGCSSGELRAAVKRGELVATTSGRRVLVKRGDVVAWLERRAAVRSPAPRKARKAPRLPEGDAVADSAARMGLRLVGGAR